MKHNTTQLDAGDERVRHAPRMTRWTTGPEPFTAAAIDRAIRR
jgi:hypothetical protein